MSTDANVAAAASSSKHSSRAGSEKATMPSAGGRFTPHSPSPPSTVVYSLRQGSITHLRQSCEAIHACRTFESIDETVFDNLKHEVMVNHIYHQQCSHLWIGDDSGDCEGVLLRQSRKQYLACPPGLTDSALALACAKLNVQVNFSCYI